MKHRSPSATKLHIPLPRLQACCKADTGPHTLPLASSRSLAPPARPAPAPSSLPAITSPLPPQPNPPAPQTHLQCIPHGVPQPR